MPRADVVVIGVGLAGLTAAARLAEGGASVALVAKGHASTHWGAGGIDLAGPDDARTPAEGIATLAAVPGHPYAVLGPDVAPATAWLQGVLAGAGLPYVGTPETPIRRVPTAIGGTRRVAIVPEAQSAALRPWEPDEVLVVAGPAGFKDFWPAAVADSLSRDAVWHGSDRPARVVGVAVELEGVAGRRNVNALELANRLDDPERRAADLQRIALAIGRVAGGQPGRVALPAVVGLRHHADAWADARAVLPLDPFEVPLVPPSVPGIRLWQALRARIRAGGGRIQVGEQVHRIEVADGRVVAVELEAATRVHRITTGAVVLATGGIAGGGLIGTVDGRLVEPLLGLPVETPPQDEWLRREALDPAGHPVESAGIRTDPQLHPVDADGRTLANVFVVGALLAGQRALRERCGDGVAVASGVARGDDAPRGPRRARRYPRPRGRRPAPEEDRPMTIADLVAEASAELDHHVSSSADECLKCNVCNTVCPVMRVTDLFPGPKYEGPQAQRFRMARGQQIQGPFSTQVPSPDHSVDYCSGCGWCTTACPAGVKIAEMNNQARARLREGKRPKIRDWGLGQTDLTGKLGVAVSPLANAVLHNGLARSAMELTVGVHRKAPLPTFAKRSFQAQWKRQGGPTGADGQALPGPDEAVVYFHGCAANYYEPHVADAAIEVLRRNGFATIVPPQVCCGLPLISNGLYDDARERATSNTAILATYARQGYRIIGTSTSCSHTFKAEYEEMLDLHDDDTKVVAEATWDICEFLLDLHEQGRLDTSFGTLDADLPYHAPCQLRSHGIGFPALELFALVPGLHAEDMDHDCCGIAGTYGLKKEKYDIAMAVGAPLFEKIQATGAAAAACDSETCRWQIESATGVRTRHPVEFLLDAYRAGDAAAG